MVARAKKRKWLDLVAGLLVGAAAQPLTFGAGGPNADTLPLHADRAEVVVAQAAGGGDARPHLALSAAIDAQRKGDLEKAALLFNEAKARASELTPGERHELTRLSAANALALKARKDTVGQLDRAESALQKGNSAEAAAVAQKINANELYLGNADKLRYRDLCRKLRLPSGGAAKPDAAAEAKNKLRQARAELAKAHLDAAADLARQADQLHVRFGARDDSPKRVLEDIERANHDPKMLLMASRAALNNGDADRAEKYAQEADKLSSPFTFAFFGDSPSKVLKEIQEARGSGKTAAKGGNKMAVAKSSSPLPTSADLNAGSEKARALVRQGRQALENNDLVQARKCGEQAAALKADLHWSEDNPAKLLQAVGLAESKDGGAKDASTNTASIHTKKEALTLLRQGRQQLAKGDVDAAFKTAVRLQAARHIHWGLFFEDTPDKLQADVKRARDKQNKEKSVELLAEARRQFQKKDYDAAQRLASDARKLHGSYSIWDLGDRPDKLLAEIQTRREKDRRIKLPAPPTVAKDSADLSHGPLAQKKSPTDAAPNGQQPNGQATLAQLAGEAKKNSTADNNLSKPVRAHRLMAEAHTLTQQNRLVEARDKLLEAQRLGVAFRPNEQNPNQLLQQTAFLARQRIDNLVRQAGDIVRYGTQAPVARCRQAEKDLSEARQLAVAFGQDVQPIERTLKMVDRLRGGNSLALVGASSQSGAKNGPGKDSDSAGHASASNAEALKKLTQARLELRKGETSIARRLAEEAVTAGAREQGLAVLRSIDAEERGQQTLNANRAFEAVVAAYHRHEFRQARLMLSAFDTRLLRPRNQVRLREILNTPEMQTAGNSDAIALTSGQEKQSSANGVASAAGAASGVASAPRETGSQGTGATPPTASAGRARATDKGEDQSLLSRTKAMREVKFQALRERGMKIQSEALERFRSGQTDEAVAMLQDYLGNLAEEQLDHRQLALLRRPLESRVQQFHLMKAQVDFANNSNASMRDFKASRRRAQNAEHVKEKSIKDLMKQYNELFRHGKYDEAEALAMRVKELDPDNPMAAAAVTMAQMQRNKDTYQRNKKNKEGFFLEGLDDTDDVGDEKAIKNIVTFERDKKRLQRIQGRKSLEDLESLPMPRRTAAEKKIEHKLTSPVTVSFVNTPLRDVVEYLRADQAINIYVDEPALAEKGINQDLPVSIKLENIALKSALNLLLHSVHLTHVIADDVLKITTEDHARGKLAQKVYQVTDLVLAVEDFGQVGVNPSGQLQMEEVNQPLGNGGMAPQPVTGPLSLTNGQQVGSPMTAASRLNGGGGGNFASQPGASNNVQVSKTRAQTHEDMLIRLITNTIEPRSWAEQGGPGTIDYHPLTMSLIINQTPDIQDQVADLLAALRRLQDQEVAVEVKFISIAEDFFERIGVNFNMNIVNKSGSRIAAEPQLTSGGFTYPGYINQFTPGNFLSGLTPAGTLTSDLSIPITQMTYPQAIPPFGGYPGIPGFGGLTMGLAFLSDIQVFLFMEAVQGDVRSNVMQAPKLTLFNGQTGNIRVQDFQFFVIGVRVIPQMGQFTYIPTTTLFPLGVTLTIQAVITADRRFVRLSLTPSMTNVVNGEVNLFPVVTPIFPLFDGTATGQPVVFTQFVQQPRMTQVSVQTTVAVPDGGTVLMGGLKRLSEGRNEYGPPVLSKIPYLNRLFRNVGYGRSAESLLIMVTPRIIIQAEEEEKQTGYRPPPAVVP